ncbi:MAG: type 4a pilus biogenesis protein PilO [Candidatus Omnitrophica bacterium]|nr:type 4a pilus biogenesis protein PilO [Candidatus Omnitrophota bacterium]
MPVNLSSIDLSKIKKEHLLLGGAVFLLLVSWVIFNNVFKPLAGKIKAVSEQIEERKRTAQLGEISPQALKDLEKETKAIRAQLDYYQDRLSATPDVPQLLKELNQIAERLKIKISSVTPFSREETLLPGKTELLLQTPLKIKMQCGYHELGIFINRVENSPRFMEITGLKINADSKDIWQHQVELELVSYALVSGQDFVK